jgi:peroxiredoxin
MAGGCDTKLRLLLLAGLAVIVPAAAAAPATTGKFNTVLKVGGRAPEWTGLLGVDGKRHALGDLKDARGVLLVFLSNRCPMTRAYEARLKKLAAEYRKRGLAVVAVSIGHSPTDRLDKMIARSAISKYNFPYCIDLSQQLGRRYGATCTPHAFLLDGKRRVAYMGAIDDNVEPARIEFHYLRDAVRAVLAGKRPEVVETLQKGCEIKYVSR